MSSPRGGETGWRGQGPVLGHLMVVVLLLNSGHRSRGAAIGPTPHTSILMVTVSVVMVAVVVEMSSGAGGGPAHGGSDAVGPTPSAVSTTTIPSNRVSTSVARGTIYCESGIYGNVTLAMLGVPIPHSTRCHGDAL